MQNYNNLESDLELQDDYVEDIQKALTFSITIILAMWGLSFVIK